MLAVGAPKFFETPAPRVAGPVASALVGVAVVEAVAAGAVAGWTWAGSSLTVRVWLASPAISPSWKLGRPGPCPGPTGTRPRRSGTPKVVWPFPP